MAYTTVHIPRHDRHRRYSWQIEAGRASFYITSEDERTRIIVDFDSPEAVDQVVGLLIEARNALIDRRQVPA